MRHQFPLEGIGTSKMSTKTVFHGRPIGIEISGAFLCAGVYFLDIYNTLDITLQHLCLFQPIRQTVAVCPMISIFVDVQH